MKRLLNVHLRDGGAPESATKISFRTLASKANHYFSFTMRCVFMSLLSMALMGVALAGNERCANGNDSIAGLYSGLVTFIDNSTEAVTINMHEDHSFTLVGRYEYPGFVGFSGVSDLESPIVGQWKSNCDKTYRLSGLQRRQAGTGGGIPGLFGYTPA